MSVRVLLVDDQPLLRHSLAMIINNEPDLAVVGDAGDGESAVIVARATRPDIILMDIRMPRLDGLEATRRICADPAALTAKVTNTKLEIAGGFAIAAPNDGRALHVAVYPALRLDGGGALTAGPFPATLEARAARPLEIRYQVQRTGLLRRSLRVDIDAGAEPLPPVVLVVRPGDQAPSSPEAGSVLVSAGGDGRSSATVDVPLDRFPAGVSTFRLLLAGPPDRPTQVFYPDPADLSVTR